MKLRVTVPDRDPYVVEIDGDEATIGRASSCDVTIAHPYVSKLHARLLRGLTIVDEGSSNGTFIARRRIERPTLVDGAGALVGGDILVEHLDADAGGGDSQAALLASQVRELEQEVRALRGRLSDETRRTDTALLAENTELRERLELIRDDVDARDTLPTADGRMRLVLEDLQRSQGQLADANAKRRALEREVEHLRSLIAGEDLSVKPDDRERIDELEKENRRLRARISELAGGGASAT